MVIEGSPRSGSSLMLRLQLMVTLTSDAAPKDGIGVWPESKTMPPLSMVVGALVTHRRYHLSLL